MDQMTGVDMNRFGVALVTMSLAPSACGTDAPKRPATSPDGDGMADHGTMGAVDTSAFGEPGDADTADLTVPISMFDTFSFQPDEISVRRGDTVAFEVTNEGALSHEFVVGDQLFQEQHEADMPEQGGDLPSDEPFAISVQPGETKSLAWTFTEEGSFTYACHVSGHSIAGMTGTIVVKG